MRRICGIALLATWLPLLTAASAFDGLVREFSRQTGSQQLHIPFFGLARFVVAVGHPAGTSELKLAVFEHPNLERGSFSTVADGLVGSSWKRIVRVRSKNGESTNIYTQRDGKQLRVLVASVDREDATFVEVRIKPETLMKFVDDHRH